MSRFQFWILLSGSSIVAILLLAQIFLARSIQQQERLLAQNRQIVATGPTCEAQWKQVATRLYEVSRQDKSLADILSRLQIAVQVKSPSAPAGSGSAAATPPPIAPQVSSPAPAPHPPAESATP